MAKGKKANKSTRVDSHLLKVEKVNQSERGMFLVIEGLEESGKSA